MTGAGRFSAGLLDPACPVPDGVLDGENNPAGRRYDVYRNNVTTSLCDALASAFPLVRKLIGGGNFATLAPLYIRSHPPTSPVLMLYGAEFPSFISNFAPLSHIGYLSDAARLDLVIRRSYHAGDAPKFNPEALHTLPPEALLNMQFRLAPASMIVRSPWPLFDIWRFNNDQNAPKPQAIAQDILVTRPEFDPRPHALPIGAATWLELITQGATLGAAFDQTCREHPDFDLAGALAIALGADAFTQLP
ncbi:MAG: hypothetical protein ACJAVM_000605 [Sulfitobacter sp.]|jgi:Putative DNA-binding domain